MNTGFITVIIKVKSCLRWKIIIGPWSSLFFRNCNDNSDDVETYVIKQPWFLLETFKDRGFGKRRDRCTSWNGSGEAEDPCYVDVPEKKRRRVFGFGFRRIEPGRRQYAFPLLSIFMFTIQQLLMWFIYAGTKIMSRKYVFDWSRHVNRHDEFILIAIRFRPKNRRNRRGQSESRSFFATSHT